MAKSHTKVDPKTLGGRIRLAYLAAGLNRSQFAMLLGVQGHTPYEWEKGAQVKADNLAKIVQVTGCNGTWLLTGRGTMKDVNGTVEPSPVVEELLRIEEDRVSAEHAAELRAVHFGALEPTVDLVRAMWRELRARDADRAAARRTRSSDRSIAAAETEEDDPPKVSRPRRRH